MLISELLNEDSPFQCMSPKEPSMKSIEAYIKKLQDPGYTPGKAALELGYKESEMHTHTEIPYKQKQLNDPRQ